jgi:hypothetical protein
MQIECGSGTLPQTTITLEAGFKTRNRKLPYLVTLLSLDKLRRKKSSYGLLNKLVHALNKNIILL